MTVTETPPPAAEGIRTAAAAVRASGALGRSATLLRLFDFLVDCSAEGRSPKESEIAHQVFGKPGGVAADDAVVRVYVHRLRQKLDEHARAAGPDAPALSLPKGAYRIVALADTRAGPTSAAQPERRIRRPAARFWVVVALFAAVNLAGWGVAVWLGSSAQRALARDPVWAPFANSPRPLLLVTGDYYIFGESDDGMEVSRLVREYQVNSPQDLANFAAQTPGRPDRYVDLGLHYLPTSSAPAAARLAALFAGTKTPEIIAASELTPDLMKTRDIIYVGYLSGLGPLAEAAFAGSRYEVGESFDELSDQVSGRRYISQAAIGPARGQVYRDYGYVARFRGPAGNNIAIVAGERDIGAQGAAEQAADLHPPAAIARAAADGKAFEAVYEVTGQGAVDFRTRLVAATPRTAGS
jgi:hypothetical protein